jgi:regulator of PEP synthase PpsR (kinase-PPPase family)
MPDSQSKPLPKIFIVSGGTGRTAEQLIRAALAQFPDNDVEISIHSRVRSAKKGVAIVGKAFERGAIICHSLVVPVVRQAFDLEARRLGVPCVDTIGPTVALLGDHLHSVPRGRAGLVYALHREQLDRMDAVDFTLAHDDGKRSSTLKLADVVLVGASRTSKSVTCFFLASRGIWAANVPLIPGLSPPAELLRLDPQRVIGLTMNAAHLESIRQTRLDRISSRPVARYADLREIQAELRETRALMARHHWECIDVSYKATEEVADQIIEMLPSRRTPRPSRAVQQATK